MLKDLLRVYARLSQVVHYCARGSVKRAELLARVGHFQAGPCTSAWFVSK